MNNKPLKPLYNAQIEGYSIYRNVAQLVEWVIVNHLVGGSKPPIPEKGIITLSALMVEVAKAFTHQRVLILMPTMV